MEKRERLDRLLAGTTPDRAPVVLWRHWPGDDQRAADLARAVVDFQITYDWDLTVVPPAPTYSVTAYGVQSEWQGALDGHHTITRHAVKRSLDWTELRPLDPTRGEMGKQLECLRLVGDGLRGDDTPLVLTLYSPLTQASMIAGEDLLIRNMRTHADRLRSGLNVITESMLQFLESLKRTPVSGILYIVEHASYSVLSEEEYRTFGVPYDLKVLEALPQMWWFNSVQVRGSAPMLELFGDYPVQALSWQDRDAHPDLAQGQQSLPGIIAGGLSAERDMQYGTPAAIRDVAREALHTVDSSRFMLCAGSPVPVSTPLSNLRAVREAVEVARV